MSKLARTTLDLIQFFEKGHSICQTKSFNIVTDYGFAKEISENHINSRAPQGEVRLTIAELRELDASGKINWPEDVIYS